VVGREAFEKRWCVEREERKREEVMPWPRVEEMKREKWEEMIAETWRKKKKENKGQNEQ
jgi:tRNA-dihydrouridine synthase